MYKFLLLAFLASSPAFALPAQVLLFRHGEKPDSGPDLSDQGWERAKALPSLFTRPEFQSFGAPVVLFAQKPKADGSQIRPFETLKYVAEGFRQEINTTFERDDVSGIVKEIRENPAYQGKLVVVCWEHNVMEDIAAGLGVRPKPIYPNDRFDRSWLLTYSAADAAPRFQDLPEHLLPGDDDK
ncbi:MAG: histidine phosphatase family protein [Bdellovibrionota bacterium]